MCRAPLLLARSEADAEAVIGEEAHIVARSSKGPRGISQEVARDTYENTILLCPTDHAKVDAQWRSFPPKRLRGLKAAHEAWVTQQLHDGVPLAAGPHLLPEAVPLRLVDRERELAKLTRVLEQAGTAPLPKVAVVTGMGGVGKTALGAYWVMAHRDRFQGQLSGDFSPRRDQGGIDVSDVLATFLRAMGTADVAIPGSLAERRSLFQQVTTGRRLLIFLDDVDHAAQVKAVLPSGAGSVVVVTSQYHLDELLYDGADAVPLDPLDNETSRLFLEEMIGPERVGAEPEAVGRLVRQCGGLPVALAVCGGKLAGRGRGQPISWLADGIDGAARPLQALSGTGHHSLQAILDFAYRDLAPDAALVYRRLGLYPGPDFRAPVVAALAGTGLDDATGAVRALEDVHIVEALRDDRFRVHDLVHQHASQLARDDEENDEAGLALRRLVDWYYAALREADHGVTEDRLRLASDAIVSAHDFPRFASSREAFRWFVSEQQNVIATVQAAFELQYYDRVWQMAEAMWPFCYNLKLYSIWADAYEKGVRAAAELGNGAAEARMRASLARAYSDQGDFERAAAEMRSAVAAAATCANAPLKSSVAEFDAIMRFERGDVAWALQGFRESRRMWEACGEARGVAIQDYQIGKCLIQLGSSEAALAHLRLARDTFARLGDEIIEGRALRRQGEALLALTRSPEAREALLGALAIAERLELRHDQAQVLEALAAVADAEAEPALAHVHRERAHQLYKEMGHPRASAVLAALGATGTADQAS
jgi:tetratricopeptide (TPR) repeat protein